MKIYLFYRQNRIDIYKGRYKEELKLIEADQECFLQQCIDYFKFISYRKEKTSSNYMTNLEGEQKLLQQVEKYTETLLKEAKEKFCTLQRHCNNPVIFYKAF